MNKGFFSKHNIIARLSLVMITLAGLASCGGSGGGSSTTASTSATEATLTGVAATGAPLPGKVTVVGANGNSAETTIDVDGRFQLSVAGMTPPFILRAIPDNSDDPALYSFTSSINSNVNVTPLTHLAVFVAADRRDLDEVYNTWTASNALITGEALANAQSRVRTNFKAQLEQAGLDVERYDFMTLDFEANGTGIDGMLDALHVVVDFNSGTVTVTDLDGAVIEFALDDPIFAEQHLLGPQVNILPGNIDIYHASLVDRVIDFIFDIIGGTQQFSALGSSFADHARASGFDTDDTVACETGGELRSAAIGAREDNGFNGSSLRNYKDCRRVSWVGGQTLSELFDSVNGEFTNQFRYVDDSTVFGRYSMRALKITDDPIAIPIAF